MSRPTDIARGADELRRLLRQQTFDLRGLDPAGFRRWLGMNLDRWQNDPAFIQRVKIRELRKANPRVRALEKEHRRATRADSAAPHFARLQELAEALYNAGKAVTGLRGALAKAAPDKRPGLREKLAAFEEQLAALRDEQTRLTEASPERQALLRIDAELRALRAEIGLDREEEVLAAILRSQGRRSGAAGDSFEHQALRITREIILPELRPAGDVTILEGVTLGAARTEFDQLVVRPRAGRSADVLAAVEVKRNINDLAHGFRMRRENLAWLTGDETGYDPAEYRTARFRTGHFDREATHGGFTFDRDSFRRFRRSPTARLYIITRDGPLWGLPASQLNRIAHRVATDERWDIDDEEYLDRLRRWCQSLVGEFEAPDLLRYYAASPGRARRVVVTATAGERVTR